MYNHPDLLNKCNEIDRLAVMNKCNKGKGRASYLTSNLDLVVISWTRKLLLPTLFSGTSWNTPVRTLISFRWLVDWDERGIMTGLRGLTLMISWPFVCSGRVGRAGWESAITTPSIRGCGNSENPAKMMSWNYECFETNCLRRIHQNRSFGE